MSSIDVRTKIKDFLDDQSSEVVVDLTALYGEMREILAEAGVQPDSAWLGLTFIGGQEVPIALAATNDQGKYREFGSVQFHVCDVARLGAGDAMLVRGKALRDLFRGQNIEGIVVLEMTEMNFEAGATLQFEGGYMSGTFEVTYHRDLDL